MRRVRIERGITMHAMAELVDMHVSAISRIESGERGVSRRNAKYVAVCLGIAVTDLMRVCSRCDYRPDPGYLCVRCGMSGDVAT